MSNPVLASPPRLANSTGWLLLVVGSMRCSPEETRPSPTPAGTGAATVAVSTSTPGSADSSSSGGPAPPRSRAPLVDHAAWVPVEVAADPLLEHRPATVECGVTGAYTEDSGYEIDTGRCNYCSRTQRSRVDIRAGDTLVISAFHDTLASVEAGQAHLALLLGDWPVWQEFIPIPASPGVVDATPFNEEILIEVDVPAGTPVGLHLHNHGYNTWNLLAVDVIPAESAS